MRARRPLTWFRAASVAVLIAAPAAPAAAQDRPAWLMGDLEQRRDAYAETALRIWELAEVGYREHESSALLQRLLAEQGFRVEAGVAGIPTAFVATWGTGGPTLGILAEFDALPGITQTASAARQPRADQGAGHACGHHLFGTASVAAAISVKRWLEASRTPGTIRVYGTPAEEGGGGKVYLVRAGLFDGVDVVLHWHAGDRNMASPGTSLANMSGKFRFHGVSAHAAAAPERGRSALDGVEAMNHMVNLMREHVPEQSRIHYVITRGGEAPNVVPDFAEVYYYARHPDPEMVREIYGRIMQAAEGAALGTGTRVEHELINGVFAILPNEALARVMHANLTRVGGVTYTPAERAFADSIRSTLGASAPPLEAAGQVEAFGSERGGMGSTDVGDVSWVVPTVGLRTATWVPGTSSHSWQAIAAGGTSIGTKGMMVAAKTLALTAADLFAAPALIRQARAEFDDRRGAGFTYRSLVGDRPPPLDYRGRE
jgi:aminobenzoyl-glutamate utilization protein B